MNNTYIIQALFVRFYAVFSLSSELIVMRIANNRTLLLQCSALPLPQLFLRVRHHSSTKLFVAGFIFSNSFHFFFNISFIVEVDFSYSNLIFGFVWNKGLSYNTNETVLRDTFEGHGEIIEGKTNNNFSNVLDP